mmetsp:Transcript_17403/g.35544  ORF Transcript_17403/g.35544 Transcript_17403/m.35544 type:complete len:214 (-) Transcript_17403:204-845(-)
MHTHMSSEARVAIWTVKLSLSGCLLSLKSWKHFRSPGAQPLLAGYHMGTCRMSSGNDACWSKVAHQQSMCIATTSSTVCPSHTCTKMTCSQAMPKQEVRTLFLVTGMSMTPIRKLASCPNTRAQCALCSIFSPLCHECMRSQYASQKPKLAPKAATTTSPPLETLTGGAATQLHHHFGGGWSSHKSTRCFSHLPKPSCSLLALPTTTKNAKNA